MSRRLLALATAALAAFASAGCTDDVAPAARVGDVRITESELLDEVAEWAEHPTLLSVVQFPEELVDGGGTGEGSSYSTALVDFVLGSRVSFEVHRAEFERRDLALPDEVLAGVREDLFGPQTQAVADEISEEYFDRLVEDVAIRLQLAEELGQGDYDEWLAGATDDVEVNPRYGSWDAASAAVVPPLDPAAPAAPAQGP